VELVDDDIVERLIEASRCARLPIVWIEAKTTSPRGRVRRVEDRAKRPPDAAGTSAMLARISRGSDEEDRGTPAATVEASARSCPDRGEYDESGGVPSAGGFECAERLLLNVVRLAGAEPLSTSVPEDDLRPALWDGFNPLMVRGWWRDAKRDRNVRDGSPRLAPTAHPQSLEPSATCRGATTRVPSRQEPSTVCGRAILVEPRSESFRLQKGRVVWHMLHASLRLYRGRRK